MTSSFEFNQIAQDQLLHGQQQAQPFEYDFLTGDFENLLFQLDVDTAFSEELQQQQQLQYQHEKPLYLSKEDTQLLSDDSLMARDLTPSDFRGVDELAKNKRDSCSTADMGSSDTLSLPIGQVFDESTLSSDFVNTRVSNDEQAKISYDLQERKYACSICQKRFKRPSSLSTHMNIHTGQRPFPCPSFNCKKSFNAKSNMLRHFKLHFKLSPGVYLLPSGEVTTKKPSSKELLMYLEHCSAIKQQKEKQII